MLHTSIYFCLRQSLLWMKAFSSSSVGLKLGDCELCQVWVAYAVFSQLQFKVMVIQESKSDASSLFKDFIMDNNSLREKH